MIKRKIIIVFVFLFGFVLFIYLICSKIHSNEIAKNNELNIEVKPIIATADVYVIRPKFEHLTKVLRGTTYADKFINLIASSSGTIIFQNIFNGNYVSKGQKLIEIDNYQLKQNLVQYFNELKNANTCYENIQLLYENHNATNVEVINARIKLQSISSEINNTKHQIQLTKVCAPIDGIVTSLKYHQSEYINQGETIARITDFKNVLVTVYIDPYNIKNYIIGNRVTVVPDNDPSDSINGKIESILPIASEAGSYPVNIRITSPKGKKLLDGMAMSVLSIDTSSDREVKIPQVSIVNRNNNFYVYIYHRNSPPILKPIVIKNALTSWVVIKDGLNIGDTILTNSFQNITTNDVIRNINYRSDY
jgi:RND family efflux transporter MFP subunit